MVAFILSDGAVQVLDLIEQKVIVHDRAGMTASIIAHQIRNLVLGRIQELNLTLQIVP